MTTYDQLCDGYFAATLFHGDNASAQTSWASLLGESRSHPERSHPESCGYAVKEGNSQVQPSFYPQSDSATDLCPLPTDVEYDYNDPPGSQQYSSKSVESSRQSSHSTADTPMTNIGQTSASSSSASFHSGTSYPRDQSASNDASFLSSGIPRAPVPATVWQDRNCSEATGPSESGSSESPLAREALHSLDSSTLQTPSSMAMSPTSPSTSTPFPCSPDTSAPSPTPDLAPSAPISQFVQPEPASRLFSNPHASSSFSAEESAQSAPSDSLSYPGLNISAPTSSSSSSSIQACPSDGIDLPSYLRPLPTFESTSSSTQQLSSSSINTSLQRCLSPLPVDLAPAVPSTSSSFYSAGSDNQSDFELSIRTSSSTHSALVIPRNVTDDFREPSPAPTQMFAEPWNCALDDLTLPASAFPPYLISPGALPPSNQPAPRTRRATIAKSKRTQRPRLPRSMPSSIPVNELRQEISVSLRERAVIVKGAFSVRHFEILRLDKHLCLARFTMPSGSFLYAKLIISWASDLFVVRLEREIAGRLKQLGSTRCDVFAVPVGFWVDRLAVSTLVGITGHVQHWEQRARADQPIVSASFVPRRRERKPKCVSRPVCGVKWNS